VTLAKQSGGIQEPSGSCPKADACLTHLINLVQARIAPQFHIIVSLIKYNNNPGTATFPGFVCPGHCHLQPLCATAQYSALQYFMNTLRMPKNRIDLNQPYGIPYTNAQIRYRRSAETKRLGQQG
jgi:hypothetical protein